MAKNNVVSHERNNSINILPPEVANKIAAGEVVERPASVVKELVENSIDAKAQNITLHIEDGGKILIKVVDDGVGMSKGDLQICIERHATSKIRDIDDLEEIKTLGFRGEALPSIVSVSETTIKTKKRGENEGWLLRVNYGFKNPIEPVSSNYGTTIEVRNLFENIPARKKFLKSSHWEFQSIYQLIKIFSVSHFYINFSLFKDGKKLFNNPPKKWGKEVLLPFFEWDILEKFLVSEETYGDIHIKLIISPPDISHSLSKNLFFFLNNRHINAKLFWKAVTNACDGIITKGTYPSGAIFIQCPPNHFDVNVHPTKMEVRFQDSTNIFNIIYATLKKALTKVRNIPLNSEFILEKHEKDENSEEQKENRNFEMQKDKNLWSKILDDMYSDKKDETSEMKSHKKTEFSENKTKYQSKVKILGQLFDAYIITETNEGIQLIDQHALHEAIIFREMLEYHENNLEYPSQLLLFPEIIDLDPEKMDKFLEIKDFLPRIGIKSEIFGLNQIIIKGIPQINLIHQKEVSFRDFIKRILGSVTNEKSFFIHNAISHVACDMAIKSGRVLDIIEMQWLLNRMNEKKITHCPHGRPVAIIMDTKEILSRFGRK